MNSEHTITVLDSYTERQLRDAGRALLGQLAGLSGAFPNNRPVAVGWQKAETILDHVDDWTLGSEGRATLYLDDEVVEADAGEVDGAQTSKAAVAVFRAYAVLLKRLEGGDASE
jgi:hypothetical protein